MFEDPYSPNLTPCELVHTCASPQWFSIPLETIVDYLGWPGLQTQALPHLPFILEVKKPFLNVTSVKSLQDRIHSPHSVKKKKKSILMFSCSQYVTATVKLIKA